MSVEENISREEIDSLLALPAEIDDVLEAAEEDVAPLQGSSWEDFAFAELLTSIEDGSFAKPVPSICAVEGVGLGLFYPGRVNGIHGEGGGGKSMICTFACAQEVRLGHHIVWVDLEDHASTLLTRLLELGVPSADILTYVHYKRPTESSRLGVAFLHETVKTFSPTLVVIDSTGESMGIDGVKANEDNEVAAWLRLGPRSTADLGPAVVLIDHVPKAARDSLMSIGSQRKSAGMDGALYSVQEGIPFSQSRTGFAKVVCGKDRQGNHTKGKLVAEFHYDAVGLKFTLKAPADAQHTPSGVFMPTGLMEKISRFLEATPGSSTNAIETGVGGNKKYIAEAITALVELGHVGVTIGARNARVHTAKKVYRAPVVKVPEQLEQGELDGLIDFP